MRIWWLATIPALAAPLPAAAQLTDSERGVFDRATPRNLEHCYARASGRKDVVNCLRFREAYPLREWRTTLDWRTPPTKAPAPVAAPIAPRRSLGDSPDRYFPRLSEPVLFDGPAIKTNRCRGYNSALSVQRDKALREGRALMEYHIRVLAMTPEQIEAEQARQRYARPISDDPELARRIGPFLGFARSVAAGEREYRTQNDDLIVAIDSAVRRYGVASANYRRAVEECIAIPEAVPVEESRPVTAVIVGPSWAGTWEGGNARYVIGGGPGGLSVSYNGVRGLNQSGSARCTVTGNRAECSGAGNYEDSDKSIAYSEKWTITLSGDTISGTWEVPQATPNWKIESGRYTPVLHTGNSGSFSMTRVK